MCSHYRPTNETKRRRSTKRNDNDPKIMKHPSVIPTREETTIEAPLAAINLSLREIEAMIKRRRIAFDSAISSLSWTRPCPTHGAIQEMDSEATFRRYSEGDAVEFVWSPCPLCEQEKKAAKTIAWLKRIGVPEDLIHCTLDNFKVTSVAHEKALGHAHYMVGSGVGMFVIYGASYGVGKSHLAVAILRAFKAGKFITNDGMLQALRASYRDHDIEDIQEACKETALLVIDDLGISGGGKDEGPMIHSILTHRYGAMLPTVITTNLPAREWRLAIGERMVDRMSSSGMASIELQGKSMRQTSTDGYFGL